MTGPEPLTTTLEELAVLHGIIVWKDPTSEAWVAGRLYRRTAPHDPAYYSHKWDLKWEPMGIGATWPEAASDALRRPVVARNEATELRAALEALAGSYVTNKVPHDNLWHMLVRTEVLERARAALAASERSESC